jgi:multidrug efflux pump subunit AcrA (membrane-fusion protein)
MTGIIQKLFLFILVGAGLAACTGNQPPAQQQAPTSTPIPTAPSAARQTYIVQRGDVREIQTSTGRWQPRDTTDLSFPIAGTVRRVTVKVGDTVTVGQLLADLQITSLEDQLASANLQLEADKAALENSASTSVGSVADAQIAVANRRLDLQKAKEGSPWPSLESARIGLEKARQDLANAQRAYDDALSRPSQPATNVDQAYNALLSAQSALRSAQNNYDGQAQNFANYRFTVLQAENALIQAQLNLEKALRGGGQDPARVAAVRSDQLKIDQIKAQIAQSSLVSPVDGEVLTVSIKPGDQVTAFTVVIVVGKPLPKEAAASIPIGDAQRLSIGLVGECQVINRPETAVQCVVRRIPRDARDPDQTTRVAASLEDLNLRTGQIIEIKMPLQVRQNVLWLPPAAIRTFQNRTFVQLRVADGVRPVDVQVGLRTTDRVEIQAGLSEGDVVEGP